MARLQIPQNLNIDTVLEFPDASEPLVVDASGVRFVEPTGLVQLSLLLQHIASRSTDVQFVAPNDQAVGVYLARMDFYNDVPPSIGLVNAINPRSIGRQALNDVLIPLRRFQTSREAEELSEDLRQFIRGQDLPAPLHSVIWDIAAELCDNAASHGWSPHGGFLAAQRYGSDNRQIAVADLGVGIRKHLARNPLYASVTSDVAAIEKAIKPGVTGTNERRGWGLNEVQEQAGRVHRATLIIRSGDGVARVAIAGPRRTRSFSTTTVVGL